MTIILSNVFGVVVIALVFYVLYYFLIIRNRNTERKNAPWTETNSSEFRQYRQSKLTIQLTELNDEAFNKIRLHLNESKRKHPYYDRMMKFLTEERYRRDTQQK